MMAWNERVLTTDRFLSPAARGLVDLISRYFATTALGRASFFDHEAASLLGISSAQLRDAKNELLRKKFLCELHCPGKKPAYGLRYGQPIVFSHSDDNEAA